VIQILRLNRNSYSYPFYSLPILILIVIVAIFAAPSLFYISNTGSQSTLAQPEGFLSPHVMFARSIDWASTPLGDMSTWSAELRQVR
jgi:hypothetical protein